MTRTEYVYVTYIASTPQRVWDSIVKPEFTRQYWYHENVSDWRPGSGWKHLDSETRNVNIVGKIIEATPPKRLVITWAFPQDENNADGTSRVTFDIETIDTMVRLTVTHDELVPGTDMERMIKQGWPRVLSSLKSFLETGKPLPTWSKAKAQAQS
jgi:uncharacterized protein YndB with AHSA1/START domain